MFFWGIISFIHAVFLPGYLVSLCLNRQKSYVNNVFYATTYSFIISIAINYVLVTVLTAFHAYTRTTMMIILGIEFLIFVYLKFIRKRSLQLSNSDYLVELSDLAKTNKTKNLYLFISVFSLSLGLILFSSKFIFQSLDTFVGWDAVCSWNRWANDFYANHLPTITFNYPQLLPALLSIPYVIIGNNEFQFFSVWISNSFYLVSIVALVSGISKKNIFVPFLLSLGIFHFSLSIKGSVGYADFPVISFVVISLSCLLNMKVDRENKELHLIYAFVAALCAAVTKQSGVFWLLVLPIVVYFSENYYSRKLNIGKVSTKLVFSCFFLSLIIVSPWYIYESYLITIGQNVSEIQHVTESVHQGASYFQRNILAFIKNPVYFLYPLMGLIGIWKGQQFKTIGLFGVLYYFIWSTFLSYDMRNCSVAVPLCCFVFGFAVDNILSTSSKNKFLEKLAYFKNIEVPINKIFSFMFFFMVISSLIGSALLENSPLYNKYIEKLSAFQDKQKITKMGDLTLNASIIYHASHNPLKIVTRNYYVVKYLPKISKEQIIFSQGKSLSEDVNNVLKKEKQIYFIDMEDDAHQYAINFNEISYKELKLLVSDEHQHCKMYYLSR